jgi:hypothetical protein
MSVTIDLQPLLLFDLQPLLLLGLCMPFITSMAKECGNLLLFMYMMQEKENVLRDIFFLFAFGVYLAIMGRTWLMAAVALMGKDDTSGIRPTTIIYMAAKEEENKEEKNNNVKQNTASKETKPDEADAPSKAPTTPPPVTEESKGPKNDKEDIYFELS